MFILAQIFGAGALIFEILTFQFKTKRRILLAQIVANSLWLLCYLCLGAFSGVAMVILALARVATFYFLENKSRSRRIFALIVLTVAAIVLTAVAWQKWFSLLAFGGWFFMTLALFQKRPQTARRLGATQAIFWGLYGLFVGSIFSVVAETIGLISDFIALWRFRKKSAVSYTSQTRKSSRE